MGRMLGWMTVVFLCCAAGVDAGVDAGVASTDPRLQEAQSAFDEAKKLRDEGKYDAALAKAGHALELRKGVLGEEHLEVAASLGLMGSLYRRQGDYSHAEPLLQRALAIQEQALGKQHPTVAISLNSLAIVYAEQGLYSRAEPLFERALAIREATLGAQHALTGESLSCLAVVLYEQGLYGRATPLFERSLAIQEVALGKQHPGLAESLNNLAILYKDQGQYDKAEALHQRALAIREAALGPQHPDVAESLNNLAALYEEEGRRDKAEPLFQRALTLAEAGFGPQHHFTALVLDNLATVYSEQGQYSRAQPLFERARAIREAVLGKQHPLVAETLGHLAALYAEQGLYGQAEPLLQRALAIREAALGNQHPQNAPVLTQLARLRLAQHRLADALPLLTRAFALSEQRLRQESLDFSESRLANFLEFLRKDEELLYALLRAHPGDAAVQRLALSAVLLRKGRSIEELSNTSRTVLLSLSPQDRDTFERLRGLRTQLAQLSLEDPGKLPPADYQKHLKELADQGDALEADLARRSAPLRALSALPSLEDIVGRVAASLPKDSALLEFVAYRDRPLVPKRGTPAAPPASELRYLALVLFPDSGIRVLDLGPAAPIDRAVSRLHDAFALREAAYAAPAQALHWLVFKPLRPVLGGTRHLFLAPDSQLSLVPFAALHDGKAFLVDSFDISYLTSGTELLTRPENVPSPGSVVVLADPDFTTPPPASTPDASSPGQRSASLERFFSTLRADVAEYAWPPLPGTRLEAQSIQRLFPKAQLFLGADASKHRLLELPTPALLHIATHGFFLEDVTPLGDSRAVGSFGDTPVFSQRPADPLLRSGLVLTGARSAQPDTTGPHASRSDSTLITALELAGLDLWGTQLVVLSACDTGRGDVKLGQGVYGLRRALVVAGAETLVMSLWKVNDESTRLLMEHYYQNLLAGQGRAAALKAAMLSVRQAQPHPYFWAPFISLGSDAPLRSLTPSPPRESAP